MRLMEKMCNNDKPNLIAALLKWQGFVICKKKKMNMAALELHDISFCYINKDIRIGNNEHEVFHKKHVVPK